MNVKNNELGFVPITDCLKKSITNIVLAQFRVYRVWNPYFSYG